MSSNEMKPAHVVRLKSGGPDMTVDRQSTNSVGGATSGCRCVWFHDGQPQRADFARAMLEPVKPSEGDPLMVII